MSGKGQTYQINLTEEGNVNQNKQFNEHFDILKIVSLKSADSASMIAEASKIVLYQSQIYVLDRTHSSLKVFDIDGNYLKTVGNVGQAEGEYLNADDFYIDKGNKNILLFSNSNRAVLKYSTEGRYIDKINLDFFGSSMVPLLNEDIAFYVNYNSSEKNSLNNIILINKDFEIANKLLPYVNPKTPAFDMTGGISQNNTGVLASAAFNDTIHQISKSSIYPKYVFDMGNCGFKDFEKKDVNTIMSTMYSYCFLLSNFIENDNLLSFGYVQNSKIKKGYYIKSTGGLIKSDLFNKNSIINLLNLPTSYSGDTLIASVNLEYLHHLKSEEKGGGLSDVKKEDTRLYKTLTEHEEGGNPIIVLYKLKHDK